MTCRPTTRRHIPTIFRRRERKRLIAAAERAAARLNRTRIQKAMRKIYVEFPADES